MDIIILGRHNADVVPGRKLIDIGKNQGIDIFGFNIHRELGKILFGDGECIPVETGGGKGRAGDDHAEGHQRHGDDQENFIDLFHAVFPPFLRDASLRQHHTVPLASQRVRITAGNISRMPKPVRKMQIPTASRVI